MPSRPKRFKPVGYRPRPSRSERGYDWRWYKPGGTREQHLRANPLCVDCKAEGIITPAKEVHHVVKAANRRDLIHEASNLVSLCKSCHSKRTARGE